MGHAWKQFGHRRRRGCSYVAYSGWLFCLSLLFFVRGARAQAPSEEVTETASKTGTIEATAPAQAEDPPAFRAVDLLPEFHGFVSQGFMKTSQNNYLTQSQRGSFEFNEVGLNLTKEFGDRLRVGMQLFMRDLGPIGNYKPQFDWFYLDYQFFDWLGLRAGRIKIPFGLYNEINDVDAARQAILLPQSMYPTQNRDYLLAQTGFELYGRTPYSKLGSLEYRAYGGTIYLDSSSQPNLDKVDIPYVFGGRLMWETALDGLRMGATYQALNIQADFVLDAATLAYFQAAGALGPGATERTPIHLPVQMGVASVEYAAHDLLISAEYSRWYAKLTSDVADAIPPTKAINERMYVMASYQITPWFSPGAYYSLWFPDTTNRKGPAQQQHDVALSLRFDPMEHWLVKVEGHYMNGTASLNQELNGGTPNSQLTNDWLLFMLKTTAYF